jgi:hypothetical protein
MRMRRAFTKAITALFLVGLIIVNAHAQQGFDGIGTSSDHLLESNFSNPIGRNNEADRPAPNLIVNTTGFNTNFLRCATGPSLEDTFTVSGTELVSNLNVISFGGFEVSLSSGSGYGTSLTLTPTGGTVAATSVYVRFNPSTFTTVNTNVVVSGGGATSVEVPVFGQSVANPSAGPDLNRCDFNPVTMAGNTQPAALNAVWTDV